MNIFLNKPDDMNSVESMLGVWRGGSTVTSGEVSGIDDNGNVVSITFAPNPNFPVATDPTNS